MESAVEKKIHATLADPHLQSAIYAATGRLMAKRKEVVAPEVLPDFEDLRKRANLLKKHTLDNLDHYIAEFEANATARGAKVVYCPDGAAVADFILNFAKDRGLGRIVKSKSMTSEEIDLNERLEHHGLEPVETDLGEYIIQLARQKPYHIVAPALHMTRFEVAEVFTEKLGVARETVIEEQTMIARRTLRERFLAADIGITGANFLLADSGAVVLCTNEGNGRFTSTAPPIQMVVAGIEKLIPRAQDLAVFLKLLGRSGTGQPLTVYTSVLAGPRRAGEIDGPVELYILLLDSGRTKLLADEQKRESLNCIRCGACLNHCPVYRKIGGHNYPWVYSGPIGAVISPQYKGVMQDPWLPFASSLCGACAEVCPVKIDLPKMLLDLRAEVVEGKAREGRDRMEKLSFRLWAWAMRRPGIYELAGMAGSAALPSPDGKSWLPQAPGFLNVGPVKAWTSRRDLPPPAEKSFRQLWRERGARPRDGEEIA